MALLGPFFIQIAKGCSPLLPRVARSSSYKCTKWSQHRILSGINEPYWVLSAHIRPYQNLTSRELGSKQVAVKGAVLNRLMGEFKIGCFNSLLQTLLQQIGCWADFTFHTDWIQYFNQFVSKTKKLSIYGTEFLHLKQI